MNTSQKAYNKQSIYIPAETTTDNLNDILEKEKQVNKMDSWNKIDKMMKLQKLMQFAEVFGKEHHYTTTEIDDLKTFLKNCLDNSKLQKSKEVLYDKHTNEIKSIPSLFFHPINRHFTLRIIDAKRVSTLKSLAPKRAASTTPAAPPAPIKILEDDKSEK